MRIEAGARTDVGRARKNNEDSFLVVPELNLYLLADGMGGQACGEVASRMAVETIVAHCQESQRRAFVPLVGESRADLGYRTNRLASATRLANLHIHEAARKNPAMNGMGATIVAAWIEDHRMSLVHVGDSRAYLLRAGTLSQLTQDHSLVADQVRRGVITPQQAERSQMQNVLTRALGTQREVEVDADEHLLLEDDSVLLCSDGLTRMVTEPEIASTLLTHGDVAAAAAHLVELANEYGGEDNVTVIALRIRPDTSPLGRLWRRLRPGRNGGQ